MSTPFYLSYAALWILVVLHSILLLGLVRMIYQLQHADSGNEYVQQGREAPTFSALDLSGSPIRSRDFAGSLTALLFVSPSCVACTTTLQEMRALSHKVNGNVIVVCRAGRNDCALLSERHNIQVPMVPDEDEHISRLFDVSGVPTAVIIDERNRIRSYGQPMRNEDLAKMFGREPGADVVEVG